MIGIIIAKKSNKKSYGVIFGIICFFIYFGIMGSMGDNTENTSASNNEVTVKVEEIKPTPTIIPTPKPTPVPTPTLSPEEQAEKKKEEDRIAKELKKQEENAKFDKWVESQFSAWDGSHRELVRLVKDNMNDPDSFEHVETRYSVNKNRDGILIIMKYRGTNAFGGVVTNYVEAKADYKENTITIVSNE